MATTTRADPKTLRFFRAAEPLLERFGYRKTTVEEICRVAGMSKRTFYELFSDKQDLLLRWLEMTVNEMTEVWESSLSPNLDPLGRLHSFLDFYAKMAREHPAMQVFFEDLELMRQFGGRTEEMRMVQMGGPIDRILRDGVAAGQFRPLNPRAAMWVMFGVLDTVYFLMPRVMNAPGPLEDPVLAEETKQFVVRGLGAIVDEPQIDPESV
ncbi:MAG: TetR/AcrR family transcriptional regulator [Gemmatimonadales bacterium]|jgi:AcrR family transcriptional regulator